MIGDSEIEAMLQTYSAAVADSLPVTPPAGPSVPGGAPGELRPPTTRSAGAVRPQRVLAAAALVVFVILVATAALVVVRSRSHPGWTNLPPAPLEPIARPTGLWNGHQFVVFGQVEAPKSGATATTAAAAPSGYRITAEQGAAFDPFTRSWTALPSLAVPAGLVGVPVDPASGVLTVLFASSGCDIPPLAGSLGAIYDPSSRHWQAIPAPAFDLANCEGWVGTWLGAKLYLWPASAPDGHRGGGVYNRTTETWSPLAAMPRSVSTPVAAGSRIYAVNPDAQTAPFGPSHIGQHHPTAVASLDPTTGRWGSAPDAPYSPVSAVAVAGQLVVWDGQAAARLDAASGRWVDLGLSPLSPRIDASVVASGQRLIVWGGSSVAPTTGFAAATFDSDGATYDFATGRWRSMSSSSLSGRSSAAAAADGTRLFLWGGDDQSPVRLTDGAVARLRR